MLGLALLCLVPELSAQRGKNKGKGRGKSHAAAKANPGAKAPAKKPAPKPGAQKNGAKADAAQTKKKDGAAKDGAAQAPAVEEADLVTATADLQAEVDIERQGMLREHFKLCDLDANGWISLREAEITLSFGRAEFQRFDAGRDGRIDDEEFAAHSDELMARLGAIPKKAVADPKAAAIVDPEALPPAGATAKTLVPRPQDLLRRYDANKSHGLDAAEISKLCSEIGLSLSTELVVEQMDPDDSGELDVDELTPLAWIAGRHLPDVLRPSPLVDEPTADGSPPAAPRARLSHFGRLDPSQDGTFDESDLRTLQGPIRLAARLECVVSAIDRDGDGRVTPEEFRSSMSSRP